MQLMGPENTPKQAELTQNRIRAIKDAIAASRSKRTREAYQYWFGRFAAWCDDNSRAAIPARPETIAAFATALQDGSACADERPAAPATIELAVSAVIVANRMAGHPVNRKESVLADAIMGSKREAGKKHTPRQVKPIQADYLRTLLEIGGGDDLLTLRDNALLGLGFAAALRRSELVGLDYGELGLGTGVIELVADGAQITLTTSKADQGRAVIIAVPYAAIPTVCDAIKRWIETAALQPGQPVFQGIGKGRSRLTGQRLSGTQAARIVKARVKARAIAFGKSEREADQIARAFSGHSLRAGFITSAAAKSIPVYQIQDHSRHRSADMVKRYIRDERKWSDSPLGKFGF